MAKAREVPKHEEVMVPVLKVVGTEILLTLSEEEAEALTCALRSVGGDAGVQGIYFALEPLTKQWRRRFIQDSYGKTTPPAIRVLRVAP